jgi:hypothetical protein
MHRSLPVFFNIELDASDYDAVVFLKHAAALRRREAESRVGG